jgi:hypothetical protein
VPSRRASSASLGGRIKATTKIDELGDSDVVVEAVLERFDIKKAVMGKLDPRDRICIGCSGKIITAFDIARATALGADWCNAARGFMFALGCIQSLSCNTDRCPTGVTTEDPTRARALVVADKTERVRDYHRSMLHALEELTAAAGLDHPREFRPEHFSRRFQAHESMTIAELHPARAGQTRFGRARVGLAQGMGHGARRFVRGGDVRPFSGNGRRKTPVCRRAWRPKGYRSFVRRPDRRSIKNGPIQITRAARRSYARRR